MPCVAWIVDMEGASEFLLSRREVGQEGESRVLKLAVANLLILGPSTDRPTYDNMAEIR